MDDSPASGEDEVVEPDQGNGAYNPTATAQNSGHSAVHRDRGRFTSQKGRVSEVKWWSWRKRAGAVVSASVSFSSSVVIVAAGVDGSVKCGIVTGSPTRSTTEYVGR